MAVHDYKWPEMVVNGWKFLEMTWMAGNGDDNDYDNGDDNHEELN